MLLLALLSFLAFTAPALAQANNDDGYEGYHLEKRGDPGAAVYGTASQSTGVSLLQATPDVFLNASVYVGIISIEVDNITAKVNLDAQVLQLLHFSAGVDASIDKVKLTITNITAKVELEARLENVVAMVEDVLHSIDLNPIIATLGKDINRIVNKTVDTLSRPVDANGQTIQQRDLSAIDYNLANNVLYSVNDYSGRTHTNRVLAQNGSIFDVFLDNNGDEHGKQVVGYYSRDMTFTGHNKTISIDGVPKEFELQYLYMPFPGIEVFSNIYLSATDGKVVRAKVIAEATGGGTSTISDDNGNDL